MLSKLCADCVHDASVDVDGNSVVIDSYILLIASDTRVTYFINFKIRIVFIMPPDDNIVNFFNIEDDYAIASSEKTFILEYNLNIITTLEQHYTLIERFNDDYYCLHVSGYIDVYDKNWIFTQTIKFRKIVSIHTHNKILAIVDEEKNYYHIFFDINKIEDLLNLVYSNNSLHIVTASNKKYLSDLFEHICMGIRTYIIFDSGLTIINDYNDRGCDKIINCNYNFTNANIFELVDWNIILSIDGDGIIQTHSIHMGISDACIDTIICDYEIKLRKTSNTKSAKNVVTAIE